MDISHKDLVFSLRQIFTLRKVLIFGIKKKTVWGNHYYDFLLRYKLIENSRKRNFYFVLSEKGKMFLRYRRRNNIRFWIPVIISILALLAGYDVYTIPLLEQILQAIMKLLKAISESLGAFLWKALCMYGCIPLLESFLIFS